MKLFTILLLLSCFISCGLRPQKSIDDRINEAIELQKNKQPEKAMAIYYQVLPEVEDLSKRSVICYNLGVMYLWDRVFDKAYDMLHQAYVCDSILKDTSAMSNRLNCMGSALNHMQDSLNGERLQRKALCLAHAVNDEFVVPTVIEENGKAVATIKENDSVIFFNFRPDRARQITRTFCDESFDKFERANGFMPLTFVCFTNYDETIGNKLVAFEKESIENTFGEFLAANNMTQLRLAETEKYAHVTFFFNGGVEEPNKGEERSLVKSPSVATYDLKPEMSAPEVSERLNEAIASDKYDVIVINFANPDMVGHTGVIPAAVAAVEKVDECVGTAVEAVKKADGVLFICADHGNAEQMIDYETGAPFTAHTTNPVPFILVNYDDAYTLREGGCLADIAPTLIEIMGLEQPREMTGKSLLVRR